MARKNPSLNTNEPPTLETCASEPIRIPAAIQPHGVLLVVREPNLEVVMASANAAHMFSEDVLGRRLDEFVTDPSMRCLVAAAASDPRDAGEIRLETSAGGSWPARLHRASGHLVVELFERDDTTDLALPTYLQLVRRFDCIRRIEDIEPLCEAVASEVRDLLGFDRVMVYRFDRDDHGVVIAEECATDMEPFLGLHYPESDIPAQARALYVENPIRVIVDARYVPVPLVPAHVSGTPLDLSHAALRSVSPIHCEYLQNMGVTASLSISIVVDGRLWGLIACHDRAPRQPSHVHQLACEFLADAMSVRISELERIRTLRSKATACSVQLQLIEQMIAAPQFAEGLADGKRSLSDLIPCDGAAVIAHDEITCMRTTPTPAELRELRDVLRARSRIEVLDIQRLASLHPPAAAWGDRAAGMIAVPLSPDGSDWLLWFRTEQVHTVRWAGDPRKQAAAATPSGRLSPRGSFAEWTETVRGACAPWETWQVEVASEFRTAIVAGVIHQASELQRLNARLEDASLHKDRMLATVSHELRNPLNAITGWVRLARMGLAGEKLEQALETIERNAVLQARLIDDLLDVSRFQRGAVQLETAPIDLVEVIRAAVDAVRPSARGQGVTVDMQIYADSGEIIGDFGRLQQVVWNLLSNAIKFSGKDSAVDVGLHRDGSRLVLEVSDHGEGLEPGQLQVIFEPFRRANTTKRTTAGLGLGLSIVKNIVELHGGEVTAHSDGLGTGVTMRVHLPVFAVRLAEDSEETQPVGPSSSVLAGLSILVVEDQPDSARMIAELLRNGGASAETADNGKTAMATLRSRKFDVIVSDLEMPEMDGFEFMAALRADDTLKSMACAALTAYSRPQDRARALQAGFRQHVSKPVDPQELTTVVASLAGRL
ncbi:MAG: response regulator [Planctomycetes bacterium]|nr:response regulator [Planctomycetota bacterium]